MPLTAKQEAFAAMCAKGRPASDAYRAAYGAARMAPASVHVAACRLLKNTKVALRVEELRKGAALAVRLEVEDVFRQLASVLRSDPARLFDEAGQLLPVHQIDDATRAAISSIEIDPETNLPTKVKFWSKTEAIDKAMRYLGLFDRDNRQQKGPNLAIQINLIGAPPPQPADRAVKVQATLVEPKGAPV
jgi:phage terminase small subunit